MGGKLKIGLERSTVCSLTVLLASGVLCCSEALAVNPLTPRILQYGTLPQYHGTNSDVSQAGNTLTIKQPGQRAIYQWDSFDISKDSTVQFIQPNSSAIALNRIFDKNFSQIDGALKANGQIYLINSNGILFNKGSQVNVHTLVASTLKPKFRDSDFLDTTYKIFNTAETGNEVFGLEDGAPTNGLVRVEEGANLTSQAGGKIILLAPNVQNNGVITTPDGQTILAAGSKVYLTTTDIFDTQGNTYKLGNSNLSANLRGLLVEVDNGGAAENLNLGQIIAERGNATLIGLAVNQSGRISATTSVNANGSIRLLAQNNVAKSQSTDLSKIWTVSAKETGTVTLGPASVTEVLPDIKDTATSPDEQQFNPSRIEVVGGAIRMLGDSKIVAPGGQVTLSAVQSVANTTGSLTPFVYPFHQALPDDNLKGKPSNASRVYLDSGSLIDVSGTQGVAIPIERNVVQVDLYGDVLKDSPLQSNSFLKGKTVSVDIRLGTPLGDYSGYEKKIGRTVAERTATGGGVNITSQGDIVMQGGAAINVSGGSLDYQGGYINTTKLISQGRIYDISEAAKDRVYDGFAGVITRNYSNKNGFFNETRTWLAPGVSQYSPGYTEGKSAGAAQFIAPAMVINGDIIGKTLAGIYQRQPYSTDLSGGLYNLSHALAPRGATLKIGDDSQYILALSDRPDFKTPDVNFSANTTPLPGDFSADTPLPAERAKSAQLAAGLMGKDTAANLEIYSNGKIDLPSDVTLVAPGGSVRLVGSEVNIAGNIVMPSGKISMEAREINGQSGKSVTVSGTLDTHGGWVNDALPAGSAAGLPVLLVNGGSIDLKAYSDVWLKQGSALDVSGGGWVSAGGKLAGKGNAGSISLIGGKGQPDFVANPGMVKLEGKLSGYGLGNGGSLALTSGQVRLGGDGQPGELVLAENFFAQGGFTTYNVTGWDALTVTAGRTIEAKAESVVLDAAFAQAPSASSMNGFSRHELLAQPLRKAVNLALAADSLYRGYLNLEQGATLRVDPNGSVALAAGRQMTVNGTVDAPAGKISLTMKGEPGSDNDKQIGFLSDQSIWLGKHANLLSRGFAQTLVQGNGLRQGEVLNGGAVSIVANKGYIVAERGSVMDVSGSSATIDVLRPAGVQGGYQPMTVASDAGSIRIETREGAVLDGALLGAAGGAGAQGGQFDLTVDTKNLNVSLVSQGHVYPTLDRQVVVAQNGSFVPAGLKPDTGAASDAGAVIDTDTFNGKAMVAADSLMSGGFDQIALQAQHAVRFNGDVMLHAKRGIQLDAPAIAASADAHVDLRSGYLGIGNSNPFYQAAPSPQGGSARLASQADLIDVTGNVALDGFAQTALNSSGDIRLKGVWDQQKNDTVNPALVGSLTTGGDLALGARQIYPATLSDFTLSIVGNPAGTVRFAANGANTPVLSAVGKLTVNAPNIIHAGVIKAPLGEISLNAANTLALGAGSITSVAAEGQIIPFGTTSNGADWLYQISSNATKPIAAPPEKRISLSGKDLSVNRDAKVDISGGGDLYASEFIPGPPGLSADLLIPSSTSGKDTYYAVVPGLASAYAPYDTQSYAGSSVKPGDSVYLSGANGLLAGVYPLLPARYALLPGAFLVQQASGYRDMLPQQTVVRADGTNIVAGYLTVADQTNSAARYSGFAVRSGASLKKEAQYLETYANSFFAAKALAADTVSPRLPVDAGRLVLAPSQSLALDGQPLKAGSNGGRGAIVDIAAPNLAVGNGIDGTAGYVKLDATALTRLGAESLLLGGTRSTAADGQVITVGTARLEVSNAAGNALKAPEIILAASDTLTVNSGSVIEGAGTTGTAQDLIVGRNGNGDGALVRVASGDYAEVKRENVNRNSGVLRVQDDVLLKGKSIALDATQDASSGANLQLAGGSLSLGAGRINLGDTAGITGGLALPNVQLAALGKLDSLYLKSYSTIDFYGSVAIGGNASSPDINHLSLDTAGLRGYGDSGKAAILAAGDITLRNRPGQVADVAPQAGSALRLEAQRSVTLGEGDKHLSGFGNVALASNGEITGQGAGTLQVDGDFSLQAARVTAASAADQTWTAGGAVSITRPPAPAALATVSTAGANLTITGQRINHQGNIELPAGSVKLTANGTGADDSVTLASGSNLSVAGAAKSFGDVAVYAPGGQAGLTSANGNVVAQTGAVVDVSGASNAAGTEGGDAGSLSVTATQGQATLAGTLKGSAQSNSRQGSYTQDSKTLTNFSALNTVLEAGGFGEQRDIRARQGDVEIAAGDTVNARRFSLAADGGKITVNGTIKSDGDKGGSIRLYSSDTLTLANGAKLSAKAKADGRNGGTVELGSTSGDAVLAAGSSIDTSGTRGGRDGSVLFRASRFDDMAFANLYTPLADMGVSANNYAISLGGVTTATDMVRGMVVAFTPRFNNTSSSKLNISVTGAKDIWYNGAALTPGRIKANETTYMVYDGTRFNIVDAGFANRIATAVLGTSTTTGTTTTNYAVSQPGVTSYKTGMTVVFTPNGDNIGATNKLNVNNLGVKDINYNNASLAAGFVKKGEPIYLVYDGTAFQVALEANAPKATSADGTAPVVTSSRAISAGDSFAFVAKAANAKTIPAVYSEPDDNGDVILITPGKTEYATTLTVTRPGGSFSAPLLKGGVALKNGDIKANDLIYASYDGTSFHLLSELAAKVDVGSGVRVTSVAGDYAKPIGTTITGASSIVVEAVRRYDALASTDGGVLDGNRLSADVYRYLPKAERAGLKTRLMADTAPNFANFHIRPGTEIRFDGDIIAPRDLNLADYHYGGEPGVLTVRAKGNLKINGSVSDGFSTATTSGILQPGNSWYYRLAAGADLSAANPLAVTPLANLAADKGNVTVEADKMVRTGTGDIAIAAGRSVKLTNAGSVIYTAGEKADELAGFTAPTLSNYAKNGGSIAIRAGVDVQGAVGSVSDSKHLQQLITGWLHRQGSTIDQGSTKDGAFIFNPSWWLRYDQFQQNVGALGGGDVDVVAGNNIDNLSAVIPTTGRVSGTSPGTASVNILGGGDLTLRAGKDIRSGIFYVARGHGELTAGGGIVSGRISGVTPVHTILALMDGDFRLAARGDVQLETVINPTELTQSQSQKLTNFGKAGLTQRSSFYTYGQDSKVSLFSTAGNINLNLDAGTLKKLLADLPTGGTFLPTIGMLNVLPGNVAAAAVGGDIMMGGFNLFPSVKGNLTLLAAGKIDVGSITVSDTNPALLNGVLNPSDSAHPVTSGALAPPHAASPLHQGDNTPIRLIALKGDLVATGDIYLPKQAMIQAGRDIVNLGLYSQNINAGDVTRVQAGRNITYPMVRNGNDIASNDKSIELGGPGRLELAAGRNIDLGNSRGVLTVGNQKNPALADSGADIMAIAGVTGAPGYADFAAKYKDYQDAGYAVEHKDDKSAIQNKKYDMADASSYAPLAYAFFDQIKLAGLEHNDGKDGSKDDAGHTMGYARGYDAIATLFPDGSYKGDLNLFFSQIKTLRGGNVDLYAPGGAINAGLANVPVALYASKNAVNSVNGQNIPDPSKLADQTGVVTVKGGSVRAVSKDSFLVNSSRVFTLQGGDILLWSSLGDIDAGKGAKTALAVPPPIITVDAGGNVKTEFQGAATGSGIRVLLAGDGKAGEVDLIAPKGAVNAGDAGIGSAGKINIAALVVKGADNIRAEGAVTGVHVDSGSPGAGLSGISNLGDASKAGADAGKALDAAARLSRDILKPSFISVDVLSLGE